MTCLPPALPSAPLNSYIYKFRSSRLINNARCLLYSTSPSGMRERNERVNCSNGTLIPDSAGLDLFFWKYVQFYITVKEVRSWQIFLINPKMRLECWRRYLTCSRREGRGGAASPPSPRTRGSTGPSTAPSRGSPYSHGRYLASYEQLFQIMYKIMYKMRPTRDKIIISK